MEEILQPTFRRELANALVGNRFHWQDRSLAQQGYPGIEARSSSGPAPTGRRPAYCRGQPGTDAIRIRLAAPALVRTR